MNHVNLPNKGNSTVCKSWVNDHLVAGDSGSLYNMTKSDPDPFDQQPCIFDSEWVLLNQNVNKCVHMYMNHN